ncbi:hypothetical protein TIFTF001_033952 [Ficus carica]|uniref:FAD-binding PCMH-type domain-containing protein n=1 Tax=Ficus carica TaxID=3494 RepID=A0AA88E092_FICCA|nr:hypothetical protein TIFTF001_033952 [Ficus carica]
MEIRTRSGGHDYEGLSYVSYSPPFVIVDLINLRSIDVNVADKTAWVQAGATIGEVYYKIAEKSSTLGFPSAIAHTVGVGGLFSGGGYGNMLRKYGLSADHIIDAQLVDVEGRVLDRRSMGEDLFWAIRGGGGASFAVVLAWKIRLVPVPSTVAVFTVNRNLEQNATKLVHQWQYVADKFDEDLFILIRLQAVTSSTSTNNKTIQATFISLFLGGVNRLLFLIQNSFPEIVSVFLLQRTPQIRLPFKGKSDYVKDPIPVTGLEGIWERLYEEDVGRALMQMTPYGGKMREIPESAIPFPHRRNIYKILYLVGTSGDEGNEHIDWIRRLYSYMTSYVTKNPRAAYLNYRDLDIGTNNNNGSTSYAQASVWGFKYFKNNFNRLVRIKTKVDPSNFFRYEKAFLFNSVAEVGKSKFYFTRRQ